MEKAVRKRREKPTKPHKKMSAIQKQIDAAKYAKRIVKTVNDKVPSELRGDVVRLVLEELSQSPEPVVAVAEDTKANPLA